MPDPAVVTLVSWAIAVKAASNEVTLSGAALAAALAGALATAAGVSVGALVRTGGGAVVAAAPLHALATIAVMAIAAKNLELDLIKSSPPAPLSLVAPRVAGPGHSMVTGPKSL
jgi:hypothetical protein